MLIVNRFQYRANQVGISAAVEITDMQVEAGRGVDIRT